MEKKGSASGLASTGQPELLFSAPSGHRKRNFWLGVTNGIIFNASSAFLNANTILPLFVSRLTDSHFLVGTAAALHEVGWFVPQLFVAGGGGAPPPPTR